MEYVKRRRKVATKSTKIVKKGPHNIKNEHAALFKKHKIKELRVILTRCDEDELLDQNESCGDSDDFQEPHPELPNSSKSIFNSFNYYQFFGINESRLEVFEDSACAMYRNASLEKTMYMMWALTFGSSEFENHIFNENVMRRSDHARERTATLQYIIRMAAVHSNRSCVFGCCKVLQRLLRKKVTLSFTKINVFQLLFNYGVDTNNPIFNGLPEEQSLEHMAQFYRNKIPDDWGLNFDALLMIMRTAMEQSLFKDPDDSYILFYIFIIYTDDAQRRSETFDKFVRIAFETFSRESWMSAVKQFTLSFDDTSTILDIIKHLPYTTLTGIEVKAVLAFETLCKICKKFEGKDSECSIHNFLSIISAAFHVKKDHLPIVVRFLDVIIRYYLETAEKDEIKVIEFAMQSFEKYVKMKCKDASINIYFMSLGYAFDSALNYKAKPFRPTSY